MRCNQAFLAAIALAVSPASLHAATNAAEEMDVPKLAPAYPEIPPTFWELHGTLVILVGLGVLALLALALWLGLRKKPAVAELPEVLARRDLESLQGKPEDGAVLSKASQAVRRYFITAFTLPPGECTTAEFCRSLAGNSQLGPELSQEVATFLRECDEHKFASGATPLPGAVARAIALVERGEALRRPSPVNA